MVNTAFHTYFMQQAMVQAERAAMRGEVPVGAIVVDSSNKVIGRGYNAVISLNDPSAHAEVQSLRDAASKVANYRLVGARLYVTLEPCPMCTGALVHARIEEVIYGAADPRSGACGSVMNLAQNEQLNHQLQVTGGVLGDICGERLRLFFRQRRAQQKALRQSTQSD